MSLAAPGTHRSGDGTLDRVFEVFRSERLLEDVIGAEGRCLGDPLDAAAIGDDDDRPRSAALDLEAPQKIDAIGLGGIEIHQAQHELVAAEGGESFLDRLRDHGLVAQVGQKVRHVTSGCWVGFDDEDQSRGHRLTSHELPCYACPQRPPCETFFSEFLFTAPKATSVERKG